MQKYDKSISHFLKAKDIYTAALGVDHPRGCHAVEGLAKAYFGSGRLAKACMLIKEVVRVRVAVLGPDHATTKSSSQLLDFYDREALAISNSAGLRHVDQTQPPEFKIRHLRGF